MFRLTVVVALIFVAGFCYAGGYDASLLPGFIVIACLPALPTLYLMIEYYVVTRKQTIKIDDQSISFAFNKGVIFLYSFSDIIAVKLFKSAGMEKRSFPYQTAEMYYHARLYTIDGKKFVITSITNPGVDEVISMFKEANIETIRTVYSTIHF